MKLPVTLLIIAIILSTRCFSQSTFKKYKDVNTGKTVAWSDGVYLCEKMKCRNCGNQFRPTKAYSSRKFCKSACEEIWVEAERKKETERAKSNFPYSPNNSLSYSSIGYLPYLYPSYQGGVYYLIVENFEVFESLMNPSATDYNAEVNVYLYIAINGRSTIFNLSSKVENKQASMGSYSWDEVKFKIPVEQMKLLFTANDVEFVATKKKLNKFDEFDYSYSKDELISFQDFGKGMSLIP